ncbi:hypothetical protein [Salinibacterium sp. ZJ450]|uniref:hypothetical protein n=1 Tax=Salinibacterium sp. ZJ450 TaxID=2708338 RepID=UPI0014219F55|nr:hypothetical protein [Salinibacterium sp. ZJ450]
MSAVDPTSAVPVAPTAVITETSAAPAETKPAAPSWVKWAMIGAGVFILLLTGILNAAVPEEVQDSGRLTGFGPVIIIVSLALIGWGLFGAISGKPLVRGVIVGRALAAGVVVLGLLLTSLSTVVYPATAVDTASQVDPSEAEFREPVAAEPEETEAPPEPVVTPEPEPEPPAPAPAPAPVAAPAVDIEFFKTMAGGDITDLNKDLDDMIVAVNEGGTWRIMGNSIEISFNFGQLEAADPPASIAGEWAAALETLRPYVDGIGDAAGTDNFTGIRAYVDSARAQLAVMQGIVDRAS